MNDEEILFPKTPSVNISKNLFRNKYLSFTKSNFIYFSSKFKPTPTSISIKFGSSILQPVNSIRNLCVIWDNNLSMKQHVSKVCSSAALYLSRIGHIAEYLDKISKE